MYKILFICMGNICRSPTAEGFFRHHLAHSGLAGQVLADSAGTHSYHIGHSPDSRAVIEAAAFGVDISGLRARKIQQEDFHQFDLILAMDHHNLGLINQLQPGKSRAHTDLMLDYPSVKHGSEVPDPYYGCQDDFKQMCQLLDTACKRLVAQLEPRLG